jgi:hypothetical protein
MVGDRDREPPQGRGDDDPSWHCPAGVVRGWRGSGVLFGDEDVWRDVPLVKGAAWEEISARGRELRAIWAGFARTGEVDCRRREGLISLRRL